MNGKDQFTIIKTNRHGPQSMAFTGSQQQQHPNQNDFTKLKSKRLTLEWLIMEDDQQVNPLTEKEFLKLGNCWAEGIAPGKSAFEESL